MTVLLPINHPFIHATFSMASDVSVSSRLYILNPATYTLIPIPKDLDFLNAVMYVSGFTLKIIIFLRHDCNT